MFQICVLDKKSSRKKTSVTFLNFFLNAMIKNIKTTMLLILFRIKNLWILVNVFNFFNENVYLGVCYDFSKFEGGKKIKV
jgi:hypothetical protein